jgi:hypothetical protein
MTDPLTGKQLVEKSYDYVDKLTKECARAVVGEYNATHKSFEPTKLQSEVGSSVVQWFGRRDKNVTIAKIDSASPERDQKFVRLSFKGHTKDADFAFSGTVGAFIATNSEGKPMSFVKTLVFSVDKASFKKRQ